MSGYSTKTVKYNDPYDVGKMDSSLEEYHLEYHGTSDVVVFYRGKREIMGLSKGEAWLLMCALQDMMENEEYCLFKQKNPFTREGLE